MEADNLLKGMKKTTLEEHEYLSKNPLNLFWCRHICMI